MGYYGCNLPYPNEIHMKDFKERLQKWSPSDLTGKEGILETTRLINALKQEIDLCICAGNWRSIVKETEPLLGTTFVDKNDTIWQLYGIVHASDDFYYGIYNRAGEMRLLSCVGSLEQFGLEPIKETLEGWHTDAYASGVEAARQGLAQDDPQGNPYLDFDQSHWMYRSFVAGWEGATRIL